MDYLAHTLLGLAFQALFVYMVLRLAHGSPRPGVEPMTQARRHALWASLVALLAGGVLGAPPFDTLRAAADQGSDPQVGVQDVVDAAAPLMALCGVYVLAQYTGPIGGGALRRADLSVRTLRAYLPLKLTIFSAVLVLLGGVALALTATLPAVAPNGLPVEDGRVPSARIPGSDFALTAGIAYLLFVGGVILALVAIVRRRRVPTLTHVEDSIIRRVFINRLLRTAALVSVAGMGSSLEFAANSSSEQLWGDLRLALATLWFATLLVVIAARPPSGAEAVDLPVDEEQPSRTGSAVRAGLVVLSARRIGYAVWCLCVVPVLLSLQDLGAPLGLAALAVGYAGFAGVQLFGEIALSRNHGSGARQKWSTALDLPLPVHAAGVAAVLHLLALGLLGTMIATGPVASADVAIWASTALVVLGSLAVAIAQAVRRPALRDASLAEDRSLRAATVRRLLLMTCSATLAFGACLLWRHASVPLGADEPAGRGEQTWAGGPLDTLVLVLIIAAVVLAVLPSRKHAVQSVASRTGPVR